MKIKRKRVTIRGAGTYRVGASFSWLGPRPPRWGSSRLGRLLGFRAVKCIDRTKYEGSYPIWAPGRPLSWGSSFTATEWHYETWWRGHNLSKIRRSSAGAPEVTTGGPRPS